MFPTEVLNNFARSTFRRMKIDAIILSGRWKRAGERKTRGGERVTPRDERRGIVGRLLTSMHLLTCSNGLRYFYIKLTAGGQVSRGDSRLQRIEKVKISDTRHRHRSSQNLETLNPSRNVFSRKYFRSRNCFLFPR